MQRIGVLGAGTMGSGIAEAAAAHNRVILLDVDQKAAEKGYAGIVKRLSRAVEKQKLTAAVKDEILGRIKLSDDLQSFRDADLVIEAASEKLDIKKEIFAALSTICSGNCILGTNTSALSVTEIAAGSGRPQNVIGIHFFNPVSHMQLVELVRTPFTSDECFDRARVFTESLGKTPVAVEEAPGFVVNRILIPMINEAAFVVQEQVASVEAVDTAMKLGANHPMGPLALADLVGLDVCLAIMETLQNEFGDSKYRPCPLLRKMVRADKLGRKTGAGFYQYS